MEGYVCHDLTQADRPMCKERHVGLLRSPDNTKRVIFLSNNSYSPNPKKKYYSRPTVYIIDTKINTGESRRFFSTEVVC